MDRTKYAIINSISGIIGRILIICIAFIGRTIFIRYLGNEYLGIEGLYTEILSILSFAELGFGSAMLFELYKPIANEDRNAIIKLMAYYKKIYRIISIFILILGLCLIPFLQNIIKGTDTLTIFELRLYFCIFLANTVSTYLVSYKFSYTNASQRKYIETNCNTIVTLICNFVQLFSLLIFKNFVIYLLSKTVILLVSRIIILFYLNKKYPILKEKSTEELTAEEKSSIIKNVKGLMIHRLSGIAVGSTDNIIILTFTGMGILTIGLISNYTLLINSVTLFISIIFASASSGIGNIVAVSSKESYRRIFSDLNFLNFWLYGFSCIAFYILVPPFITLWIGSSYLIDEISFFLIIINTYIIGQSNLYSTTRNATGDFSKDKWIAFFMALINLSVSIVGAIHLGLAGVYLGSVVSRLFFVLAVPLKMHKYLFEVSPKEYYIKIFKYFATTILAGIITNFATMQILQEITLLSFIKACVVIVIIPNIIFFILYFRSQEFLNLYNRFKGLIIK